MKNSVVIKSNRSGMTVILDPELPFEQLLQDVAVKFGESAKFWGSVQMALTLAGRDLSPERLRHILDCQLRDTAKASLLKPDGSYEKKEKHGKEAFNAQLQFALEAKKLARAEKKAGSGRVFIPETHHEE